MSWVRTTNVFALVATCIFAQGCGDDGSVPESTGTPTGPEISDAGPSTASPDANVPRRPPRVPGEADHESYIPSGLAPDDATRLIVLGDSISAGNGASHASLRYYNLLVDNEDGSWPDALSLDLTDLMGTTPDLVHVAEPGATTMDMVGNQLSATERVLTPPVAGHSVVVLTIGGNDLKGAIFGGDYTGPTMTRALDNIRTTVEFFQDAERFPDGASIYIANVYDPSDDVGQIAGCFFGLDLSRAVAAMDVWHTEYVELGTEMGFAVVDMLGHFKGHGHHHGDVENPNYDAADPTMWFADCLHPNDRGHHELRRLFMEAMDPVDAAVE